MTKFMKLEANDPSTFFCVGGEGGEGALLLSFVDALSINVDEDSDADQTENQIGSAITDEGHGHAFIRENRGSDADIDHRLDADEEGDPDAENQSKSVACFECNVRAR